MNLILIKSTVCFISMIVMLVSAIATNDVIQSQLYACIGIISGALTLKCLSTQGTKSK